MYDQGVRGKEGESYMKREGQRSYWKESESSKSSWIVAVYKHASTRQREKDNPFNLVHLSPQLPRLKIDGRRQRRDS